jgi:hypothetical protein
MTIRYQVACWIGTALLQVAAPRTAEAQIPAEETAPGLKSGSAAFLWSFLGTVVPAGVAIASKTESSGATSWPVILGAFVLGPSLGHFYADRPGRAFAGIGIRALAVVGLGAGVATALNGSGGEGLAYASLALGGAVAAWDIIAAPHSAQVHNESIRPGRIAIALTPALNAPGVQIGALITF